MPLMDNAWPLLVTIYLSHPLHPLYWAIPGSLSTTPRLTGLKKILCLGVCHVMSNVLSAVPAVSYNSVFQEEPGDLSGVSEEYHDLPAGFSWSCAASLPPHIPMIAISISYQAVLFRILVNDVLRYRLIIFVFVYLDDILIFLPSLQTHVQRVR